MKNLFYKFVVNIFRLYFKIIHRCKITGKENIPEKGSLVIMANHISLLDPPIVGCFSDRRVYYMAKSELFRNKIFGNIIKTLGAFPVKRGRPDRGAIKKAYQLLEDGKVMGMFPEGTRSKTEKLGRAKSGAVMIPIRKEAPILPVGIKFKKWGKLVVSIGEPFTLDEYYNKKLSRDKIKEAGSIIMKEIKKQLDSI